MTNSAKGVIIHPNVEQGTEEWFNMRRGILTASEMNRIITPAKLQYSSSEKERSHLYELAAQTVTGYTEPTYVSNDMLRGRAEEIAARATYSTRFSPVETVGFITNDRWGFTIGCSPDGLVGSDGQLEIKSRAQKFQLETILKDEMPDDYKIQVQTALLVSERPWCDFVSYCGGMPMFTKRVYADSVVQDKILEAAGIFYEKLVFAVEQYDALVSATNSTLVPTSRVVEQEMYVGEAA
jgi:predicted phage-related endonuclease